jgi:mRNA-degrading endonuclease RelE of RelBE toxin-antitoxin system
MEEWKKLSDDIRKDLKDHQKEMADAITNNNAESSNKMITNFEKNITQDKYRRGYYRNEELPKKVIVLNTKKQHRSLTPVFILIAIGTIATLILVYLAIK